MIFESYRRGDRIVEICYDEDPQDPREWDNISLLVCFHKRHSLGDKHELDSSDFDGWEAIESHLREEHKPRAIFPVFMHEHSGRALSLGDFGDQWDSGQIGFAVVTAESIAKVWGEEPLTDERIREIVLSELKVYEDFLNGTVFEFCEKSGEETKSLIAGYFGLDFKEPLQEIFGTGLVGVEKLVTQPHRAFWEDASL